MAVIDISTIPTRDLAPGIHARVMHGHALSMMRVHIDAGSDLPEHSHPHEQGGMLIRGTLELTIGDETRLCQPGSMFLIPPNVKHRAVAVGGPCVVLDVFSPVREDYAELVNHYIPPVEPT